MLQFPEFKFRLKLLIELTLLLDKQHLSALIILGLLLKDNYLTALAQEYIHIAAVLILYLISLQASLASVADVTLSMVQH